MSKTKKKSVLWLILVLAVVILVAVVLLKPAEHQEPEQTDPAQTETVAPETEPQPIAVLRDALRIDQIGSYTGIFVEDGSDEAVSNLLMMVVTNITPEPIQYAAITLDVAGETAEFNLSVLPAGETAILIEQNRMAFDRNFDYGSAQAECLNLAGFDRELSLQSDKLEIQVLNGAINLTNISGADITGTILLYYKNINNGVYHGGIAYRVRLEEGMKEGEIRQITGAHFHQTGSRILFVDIVE